MCVSIYVYEWVCVGVRVCVSPGMCVGVCPCVQV